MYRMKNQNRHRECWLIGVGYAKTQTQRFEVKTTHSAFEAPEKRTKIALVFRYHTSKNSISEYKYTIHTQEAAINMNNAATAATAATGGAGAEPGVCWAGESGTSAHQINTQIINTALDGIVRVCWSSYLYPNDSYIFAQRGGRLKWRKGQGRNLTAANHCCHWVRRVVAVSRP